MLVDPAVTRRKFELELERVQRQAEILRGWGCFILRHTYPTVDAIFVPRRPLVVSIPVGTVPRQGGTPDVQFAQAQFHMLACRAFGVRISLDDFDQRAPSVVFHDPWTWDEIPYEQLHRGNLVDDHGKAFNVLPGNHPLTGRAFLCTRGIREYHEHPQHSGDDWMLYRGDFGLFAVLTTIWRTCVDQARPDLRCVITSTQGALGAFGPQTHNVNMSLIWEAFTGAK